MRMVRELQLPFLHRTLSTLDSGQPQWNLLFSGCHTKPPQTVIALEAGSPRQAMASPYLVRAIFWWPFLLIITWGVGQELSGGSLLLGHDPFYFGRTDYLPKAHHF